MKKRFWIITISLFLLALLGFFVSRSLYTLTKNNPYQTQDKLNFLILGLDPRNDELEKTNTTDTIILASLDLKTATTSLISLPRDLWYYPLSSKINQIYPLSLEQTNDQLVYIQDHFSHLTGQKINHTFILTTQDLIDFVDILGGVDLDLETGFTDDQFPNPDYIQNPSPDIPIYITVSFSSGQNHIDKTNVNYFVRSRKNANTASQGGTDLGRSHRQQLLLEAILQKIKDNSKNLSLLKKVYDFYHQQIQTNFTDQDALNIFLTMKKNILNFSLKKITIPAGENPKTDLIYYPGHLFQGQWVFLPQQENYQSLQQFISNSL